MLALKSALETWFQKSWLQSLKKNKILARGELKLFFKKVHPDFFSQAPRIIQNTNSKSIQELNSYLDGVEQNIGVPQTKLEFYIRKLPQKREASDNLENEKEEEEELVEDDFSKLEIELMPLKINSPDHIQLMHLNK